MDRVFKTEPLAAPVRPDMLVELPKPDDATAANPRDQHLLIETQLGEFSSPKPLQLQKLYRVIWGANVGLITCTDQKPLFPAQASRKGAWVFRM